MKKALLALVAAALVEGQAGAEQITLAWEHDSTPQTQECGFTVEHKTDGPWAVFGTTDAGVKTYQANGLVPDVQHCFRVLAFNEHGASSYSNEACGAATKPDEPGPSSDAPDPAIAPCVFATTIPQQPITGGNE